VERGRQLKLLVADARSVELDLVISSKLRRSKFQDYAGHSSSHEIGSRPKGRLHSAAAASRVLDHRHARARHRLAIQSSQDRFDRADPTAGTARFPTRTRRDREIKRPQPFDAGLELKVVNHHFGGCLDQARDDR
jgi:hypothetical protein